MTRRYVLISALALLAASSGAMAWSGKGSYEPSTTWDTRDGFMWPEADTSPIGAKVYFNGFLTDGEGLVTSTSPNLGSLETGFQTRAALPMVMMGVWKDCNRDDFVGNSEANWVYPANLPGVDTDLCPPTPGVYPTHNDGRWIYEFHSLTWSNETRAGLSGDANTLVDNGAKVWADFGLPDSVLVPVCDLSPQPAGTYQSTGGALALVDCQDNYRITRTINDVATITGQDQLSFEDQPNGRQGDSDSALNVVYPLGESSDDGYVEAFDCSNPPERQSIEDPLGPREPQRYEIPGVLKFTVPGSSGYIANYTLNTNPNTSPSPNAGGSFWGTLNETDAGSSSCKREEGTVGDADHCVGGIVLIICEQSSAREFKGRVRPDSLLISEQWKHNYTHTNPVNDLMDKQGDLYGSNFRKFWYTFDNVDNTGPATRDGGLSPAQFWTFYGFVSPGAISKYTLELPGATGAYGSQACAASALDGKARFDCNKNNWWFDPDGTPTTPREAGSLYCWDEKTGCDPRVFVGDAYNLRDIDCYDYSIGLLRAEGVSTAHLAGTPC